MLVRMEPSVRMVDIVFTMTQAIVIIVRTTAGTSVPLSQIWAQYTFAMTDFSASTIHTVANWHVSQIYTMCVPKTTPSLALRTAPTKRVAGEWHISLLREHGGLAL